MELTEKSKKILEAIAGGYTYNRIIEDGWADTYADIMAAAKEALTLSDGETPTWGGLVAKDREQYPNFFRPWREEDETILRVLFEAGETLESISVTLGRRYGGVRTRLKKLGVEVPKNLSPFEAQVLGEDSRDRRLRELHEKYPMAYEPWTAPEDAVVAGMHAQGLTVEAISVQIGRQRGAVASRIRHLGLEEESPPSTTVIRAAAAAPSIY